MNNIVALKGLEVFENNRHSKCLQNEPALVIDFLEKRSEKIQKKIVQLWAHDGLWVMKVMISDYKILMEELAQKISPEQLAEVTPLSAQDQIREDLRRLIDLVAALESLVSSKLGMTLTEALEILGRQGSDELSMVIDYLKTSEYPIFQTLIKVCEYTAVCGNDADLEAQVQALAEILAQMGAQGSVNALNELNSNIFVALN